MVSIFTYFPTLSPKRSFLHETGFPHYSSLSTVDDEYFSEYLLFNLWITRRVRNKLLWALRYANVHSGVDTVGD